ncbi:uncharacterized protein [Rutidosis leptorrhynchoides]|uniref:uncharacterized protein n=1 Tax=Rutidosis leptorrhynchoides TaxID=125765 RepID=UPI003A99B401
MGAKKDCVFRDKLKNVKSALKSWSKCSFGMLDSDINELKNEATAWEIKAESNNLSDSERVEWLDCRRRWLEKESTKANMLKKKARIRWTLKGDENSKYFHASIRRRYNKCNIRGLNINGVWNKNPDDVKNAVFEHFTNFFKKPSEVEHLKAEFSEHEIWLAVTECGSTKAPGPNGFNLIFFKKYWDTIKGELIEVVCEFRRTEKISDGYNASFITLILECLRSVSISVLVNGSPTKEFKLGRGVRQGDPLSTFLFILAAEGLNLLVKAAVRSNLLEGVLIDDTIFFGSWSEGNIDNLMSLLKCFELTSGLKVNYNKSNMFGNGVEGNIVESMASLFGCKVGCFPFKYLGLPISANMSKYDSWKPVIEKFEKRLSDWKACSVSFGGRLTLINSVLNSLPLYYFSLFRAPPCVLKKLESVRRNSFIKKIADRRSTSFWNDPWLISEPLKDKFPRFARLDSCSNAKVSDRVIQDGENICFCGSWVCEPRGRNISDLDHLKRLLDQFQGYGSNEDSWVWKLSSKGTFSTKELTGGKEMMYGGCVVVSG